MASIPFGVVASEVWLAAAASAAFLALALLAAARRARHPLAVQLGLMSVGLFAYNLTEVLSTVTGQRSWVFLGDASAALTAVPTFGLFVGFLGGAARSRRVSRVLLLYFAALAVVGLAPLARPALAWLHDSGAWSLGMLGGLVPAFLIILAGILRERRRHQGAERMRLQMLGGALLVGLGSVLTDLAAMTGLPVPRLSYVGLLASSLLVAALVLEARIIEGVRVATAVNAVVVAMLAVVGQVVVLAWAGDRSALVFFGTVVVVALSVAALVPVLRSLAEQRARTEQLATLGRFAQQMAHDIRNPLAAIKGAAQFLEQERAEGRSLAEHGDMLAIIVERVDRIERFIADYQRMGRVEPLATAVEPNQIVDAALRAVDGVARGRVEVVKSLAGTPRIRGDADLLVFALENVVRNACEAMPDGGTLTVSTGHPPGGSADARVAIAVQDTGVGMDVRTRERALGGLFTTKADGSGLGLTFVRRVVEAHRGSLTVASEEGRGTTVTLELPVDEQPSKETGSAPV